MKCWPSGRRISAEVLQLPYVDTIEQQIGRAELGEDTWGPHRSEFHIELKPQAKVDQAATQQKLRGILQHYPGIQSEVVTFLGDRISESLSGESAQVAIKVYGEDLDILDSTGTEIAAALRPLKGITDLQFKRQGGTPTIGIQLDPPQLAAAGMKVQDVLDTIETAYAGARVGQTFRGTRTIDVDVLLPESWRHQPARLAELMVSSPFGPVPLSQVARVYLTQDRYSIEHDGGQRRVSVTFNVRGESLQRVVQNAQRVITASVHLRPGVFLEYTGAAAAENQARNELLLYSACALALIVVILFVAFRWLANSWLVLANLPFSVIGSVFAIAVTGVRNFTGYRGRARDRIRDQCSQCHLATRALRTPGRGRGGIVESGACASRGQRATGSYPHDGHGYGARPRATGVWPQSTGPGDRGPTGSHGARRVDIFNAFKLDRAASIGAALRASFPKHLN